MDKDFLIDGLSNEDLVNTINDILKRKKEISYKDDNDKFEKLKTEFPPLLHNVTLFLNGN